MNIDNTVASCKKRHSVTHTQKKCFKNTSILSLSCMFSAKTNRLIVSLFAIRHTNLSLMHSSIPPFSSKPKNPQYLSITAWVLYRPKNTMKKNASLCIWDVWIISVVQYTLRWGCWGFNHPHAPQPWEVALALKWQDKT